MDINQLMLDLIKFKEDLSDSMLIAIGLNELNKTDLHVAHDIVDINGESYSNDPFQQIANLYKMPRNEVIEIIRDFTNEEYNISFLGNKAQYFKIEFEKDIEP